MEKTVLITGTSSGIGKACVELFAARGWHVYAGSRHPERLTFDVGTGSVSEGNGACPPIHPTFIDVNDASSIASCFAALPPPDCVVNNAGYGRMGPFEALAEDEVQAMFRTNVFGLMEVCRHAAKRMRTQRTGSIVNISSVAGRRGFPFYAAYVATKWAVEGFSESLWHELQPFGIRVKLVEPGRVRTEFFKEAYTRMDVPEDYRSSYESHAAGHDAKVQHYTDSSVIAGVIYGAAVDPSARLRYPAGADAVKLSRLRQILPDGLFLRMMSRRFRRT